MTSSGKAVTAVKLPFKNGEYLCTWQIPGDNDSKMEIPGLLTVEVDKYPYGQLYGDLPINWQTDDNGGKSAGFPQRQSFDTLTGRLSTGAYVALMNGELSYMFENQGRAIAAFAVMSRDEFDVENHRKYSSIEIQIEGIEAITGLAPISHTQFPATSKDDPTYSATVSKAASHNWISTTHKMSFSYNGSFRSFDFYEFSMVFSPVLRLESDQPLTILEWWMDWIRPLRQMISLMTNAPRDIRYMLAANGDSSLQSSRDQVFGWDIINQSINSTTVAIEEINSSINLTKDNLSLLEMLERWQELAKARHPLVDTYGSMVMIKDQHPRSRFLLLLQALEGLYGFENSKAREQHQEKHSAARTLFIERAKELLTTKDLKFLDKYLMKSAPQGLEQALIAVFKSLPINIISELERTKLIAQVRNEYGITLRTESALVKVRNALSHGSSSFAPEDLKEAVEVLDRVVRSEALRLLGAPIASQERALKQAKG